MKRLLSVGIALILCVAFFKYCFDMFDMNETQTDDGEEDSSEEMTDIITLEDTNSESITQETDEKTSPDEYHPFYTTNTSSDAKKGSMGKYAYSMGNGDGIMLLDFEQGFAYMYDDSMTDTCDRIPILSGTLNDTVYIGYRDTAGIHLIGTHFKYVNMPDRLIVDFYTTEGKFLQSYELKPYDVEYAIKLLDKKQIIVYQ